MKAVFMTAPGSVDVLELRDAPAPEIKSPTEIKVRLFAAGINPVDTKIRSKGLFYGAQPPAILGCDGAGEVVQVGAAASRFQVGDPVWFCHGGLGREQGNYAEYTVLEESRAEFKPRSLDFVAAAAAPLVLITAWEALFDRGRLEAGQTVLIHAGAGGVGHVAIQLAKIRGARVAATVSNAEKAALATSFGAELTINYREQDLAEEVMRWTQGRGADLVFDTVGPEVFKQSIPLTAVYGSLVSILDPGAGMATSAARNRNLNIGFTLMLTPALMDLQDALAHQGEILRLCGEWMDEGRLKVVVEQTFSLDQAQAAHRLLELGHCSGKLVLEMTSS